MDPIEDGDDAGVESVSGAELATGGETAPASLSSTPVERTPEEELRYDPFALDPFPKKPEAPAPATTPAPTPGPAVDPATQSPAYQALLQQVQTLKTQLDTLRQPSAPTPATPPATPAPARPPRFNAQLPQQVFEALNAEDPMQRYNAMNGMLNALANAVHAAAMQDMQQYIQNEYTPRQTQALQTSLQARETSAAVARDFYGKYPELDDPVLHPTVMAVAQQYYSELGGAREWNAHDRDEIGKRVRAALQRVRPTVAPPAPAPRLTTRGARPTAPQLTEQQRHMNDFF